MDKVRLKNWSIYKGSSIHYHIAGEVYGHERFIDGTEINTSRIVFVDGNSDEQFCIVTLNTRYICDLKDFDKNAGIGFDDIIMILNRKTK